MLHVKDNGLSYVGAGSNPAAEPFAWLRPALGFLSRSRRTIATSATLFVVLGLAYLLVATPKYDASAYILIDLRQADLFRQQAVSTDALALNAIVESQVEIIRSTSTATAAIRQIGPEAAAELDASSVVGSVIGFFTGIFSSSDKEPTAEQAEYANALKLIKITTAKRVGITNIIGITVRTTDSERSARLANAVAQAYISDQLEAKYETTRRGGAWLQTRLAELRDQALDADRKVQEYKARMNIVDTDKGLMSERQVGDLNSSLTVAQGKTAEAKARYDRVTDILRASVKDGAVSDMSQNQVIVRLRQQYFDTAKREADISAKYGQNHIAAVNARSEMAELERSLRGELMRIAEATKSDYEVARAGEDAIRQQLDRLVADSSEKNRSRVELRSLESSSQTYRSLYENFLQKYTQAVQDQSFPISEARVFSRAEPPLGKAWPKLPIVLAAALVLGLMIGTAVAFLREMLRQTVKMGSTIEQVTGLHCLATVPRIATFVRPAGAMGWLRRGLRRTDPASLRELMLYSVTHPNSPTSEVMQEIKLILERRVAKEGHCSVIGMISAIPGEGKTTIASNLAHHFAQTGKRVLILDWDLRNPSLSQSLAPTSTDGLLQSISSGELKGLITSKTRGLPLHILPCVGATNIGLTSDILRARGNVELMAFLRTQYDFIFVDFPPVVDFVDVRATDTLIDAYLLVVGYDQVDKSLLAECVVQGKFDSTRVVGAVLNGVDPRQYEQKRSRTGRYLAWMQSAAVR